MLVLVMVVAEMVETFLRRLDDVDEDEGDEDEEAAGREVDGGAVGERGARNEDLGDDEG